MAREDTEKDGRPPAARAKASKKKQPTAKETRSANQCTLAAGREEVRITREISGLIKGHRGLLFPSDSALQRSTGIDQGKISNWHTPDDPTKRKVSLTDLVRLAAFFGDKFEWSGIGSLQSRVNTLPPAWRDLVAAVDELGLGPEGAIGVLRAGRAGDDLAMHDAPGDSASRAGEGKGNPAPRRKKRPG